MQLIDCDESHLGAIRQILNHTIANSTAIYEDHPRTAETVHAWWQQKQRDGFPVLGLWCASDGLVGFATYGTFRAWPGYRHTVEHSLYVDETHRGRGVGRQLLAALIDCARAAEVHVMIGGIDAQNAASIALHTSMGFAHVGTLPEVGLKFGRWLDLCFYQLTLDGPASRHDGVTPPQQ